MNADEGQLKGEKRAERGIKRAAYCHEWDISRDELRLLETMLRNPDEVGSTESARRLHDALEDCRHVGG